MTYRMAAPPVPAGGLVALSLREGSWLALLGSLMMVLGPIWPRVSLEPAHGRRAHPSVSGAAGGPPSRRRSSR